MRHPREWDWLDWLAVAITVVGLAFATWSLQWRHP